jgi:hypothetical protein
MSQEDFDRFRLELFQEQDLQIGLREIMDRQEFIARVVHIGSERGYGFTAKHVEEAMRASRRSWMDRGV